MSYLKFKSKQDKANYAVSEREDRVTGPTTLTRMAGCNEMYWAATVLCLAVRGFTRMYWAATVLCRAVLGCTGMYLAVLGCNGLF